MFDPYRDWLDIPPEEQPPTHYRLLEVAPEVADAEVIKEAALRQTTRVRVYQAGPQAEACTRLLNEIAQARATLLNAKLRQEYDTQLAEARERRKGGESSKAATAPVAPGGPVAAGKAPPWARPERLLAALGYALLLLCGFVISFGLTLHSLHDAARHRDAASNPRPADKAPEAEP